MRRIHSTKPIEQRAKPAINVWSRKREPQWKKEETNPGYDNCCRDSFREDEQFAIGPTKKWRDDKEEIDRHVRQNKKRNERNLVFPFKIKRADVGTTGCDPVATAVNDQEQDRQSGRDNERLTTFKAHGVRPKP